MAVKERNKSIVHSGSEPKFECSKELKILYQEEYDKWKVRHRAGLEELGQRCGLSASYLSQIGRYGRIPSRSALILLALNFDLKNPERIFRAANIKEPWPIENGVGLYPNSDRGDGLVSIKFDSDKFADLIRDVMRAEVRPRSAKDLLKNRPLRIGFNPLNDWAFVRDRSAETPTGFFPEICELLASSLQCQTESRSVAFADFPELFARGEIDMFGPIVTAPNLPTNAQFSSPLYRVGMSALFRIRTVSEIPKLPEPKTVYDLSDTRYEIAVLRNGRAHILANTLLKRSDDQLILCSSHDEAVERITLKGIRRPAHVFLVNSISAHERLKESPKDIKMLFATPETVFDKADVSIAVRGDWPELMPMINDSLSFLEKTGSLSVHFKKWFPKDLIGLVDAV